MDERPVFPQPWVRAALPHAILACLESGPAHGYALAQALGARGFGVPRGGSLYPVLGTLETDGFVRARWVDGSGGPGRKEYEITADGIDELTRARALINRLTAALERPRDSTAPPSTTAPSPPAATEHSKNSSPSTDHKERSS